MVKKHLSILLALFLLSLLAAGCSGQRGKPSIEDSALIVQEFTRAAVPDSVDLTALSSAMAFAALGDIMAFPDDYIGKTVKMGGAYQSHDLDATGLHYHYALVADEGACCQQWIEFEWTGGHTYPDDYPQDGTQIEVTGVLGSYEVLGHTVYRLTVDEIVVPEK